MTCPTCTFPAGCTCKPPSLLEVAIQEVRDAAAAVNAAVDRLSRATAQLNTARLIERSKNL